MTNLTIIEKTDGRYIRLLKNIDSVQIEKELSLVGIHLSYQSIQDLAAGKPEMEIKIPDDVSNLFHDDIIPPTPSLAIEVSEDNMMAFITVDFICDNKMSLQDIVNELKNKGIVFGIDIQAIENSVNNPGTPAVAARGINPLKGQNASIQYFFEKNPTPKPVILANDIVDYYELGQIIPVYAGDILAVREPATAGTPGIDIYGKEIAPQPGDDIDFKMGRGIIINQNEAVAEHAGALSWINNKMYVTKLYHVLGDVDFSIGNIDFMGKVLISGSVYDGFKVEADDDIDICGGVGNALINSRKGSVFVQNGIIGRGKALVTAHKNVEAKFVQAATVVAGQSIVVNEYIVRCNINAGDSVLIHGRKGRILGNNKISAKTKIKASRVKNSRQLDLRVVGIERKQYFEKIHELNRTIERLEGKLKQSASTIRILRNRPEDARSLFLLEEMLPEYINLQEELDTMIEERNYLSKMLKSTRGEGMIEIGGGLEEGMTFSIKHEFIKLPQDINKLNMYYDPDEKKLLYY